MTIFFSSSGFMYLGEGVLVKSVEKNSSIFEHGLRPGMIITEINGKTIKNLQDYADTLPVFVSNETTKISIKTKDLEIIDFSPSTIFESIIVEKIPKTNIKTGLDIQGGARAVIAAEDHSLTDQELVDLIAISQERLNLYGLTDMKITSQNVMGERFMVIEIAGSSPSDLENLIAQQGKFEAKIGNETVFVGGNKDITYVGRSGQDAGIYDCFAAEGGQACTFRFVVYLSEQAAQRHASITANMSFNLSSGGRYLEKQIDFFVDGKLTESLNIGEDLKGKVATQIMITGSGTGVTQNEAIANTQNDMKKLQTVLITGSLPFKLKIVKIDRISPLLGETFTKAVLTAGIFAIFAVSIIILIRYRRIKISLALLLTSFSEILIILGVAALIKWNLDLPSIAGIIATIGTGVDSQIVILDESRFKTESLKIRIKKALFIIFTSFATVFVSLIPLTGFLSFIGIEAAGGGMLKGFAITSLIGITAGVFITRPAFADIIKQLGED